MVFMPRTALYGRIVTMSSKGQCTIPVAYRTRWGLQPGDKVALRVTHGVLHVQAATGSRQRGGVVQ